MWSRRTEDLCAPFTEYWIIPLTLLWTEHHTLQSYVMNMNYLRSWLITLGESPHKTFLIMTQRFKIKNKWAELGIHTEHTNGHYPWPLITRVFLSLSVTQPSHYYLWLSASHRKLLCLSDMSQLSPQMSSTSLWGDLVFHPGHGDPISRGHC